MSFWLAHRRFEKSQQGGWSNKNVLQSSYGIFSTSNCNRKKTDEVDNGNMKYGNRQNTKKKELLSANCSVAEISIYLMCSPYTCISNIQNTM